MFNESFKYYKSKSSIPDFGNVIDFEKTNDKVVNYQLTDEMVKVNDVPLGIQSLENWKCFTLSEHLGLLLIRNVFTVQGQRYWMARCLRDYPKPPNRTNLNEGLYSKQIIDDWWTELRRCDIYRNFKYLKNSLRWTTLGYHHNWDTKIYTENARTTFPKDLATMCRFIATICGWKNFKPEAAIINYYPLGTTLAGHTDHSEHNLDAPLFSFSFGQTAIFLLGGRTRDTKPSAMFLRSGDVLVMSEHSRLCFHAVPRIMKAEEETWNNHLSNKECTDNDYNNKALQWSMDAELYKDVGNNIFWTLYQKYLDDSRLNINVRQVLKDDQNSLD